MLVVGAPYWLVRMVTSGRYRAGLAAAAGAGSGGVAGGGGRAEVVWVHAVSVGEVMAATRLVAELETALAGWVHGVSTTTATGQALAKERFGADAGVSICRWILRGR